MIKKAILSILLILGYATGITAQQSISETEKLASLGKIYGFLKYYHPEVAKGDFDWDQQFIAQLPKVLKATDKNALSEVYSDWIEGLGEIKKCRKCDTQEDYFDKNFDLSWTQNPRLFTTELSETLTYIENNRNQKKSFYAAKERVGKIEITNEPNYKNFEYPEEAYRLLGLFKYWNIIEYFYPYKYLTDQNWDAVLIEMIPKIKEAANKEAYQLAIKELIAKLDDAHAWVNFSNQSQKYLPLQVSHLENKAVVSGFYNDSLAKLNKLKLGDVILKVNGKDFAKEAEKNLKYVSGSNTNNKIKRAYIYTLNGSEDQVLLTIEREGKLQELPVNRYDFRDFEYWNTPQIKSKSFDENVGYINMARLKGEDIKAVFESFENKNAIIIDLRNYPAFIYKRCTRYLNSEKRDFTKIYTPSLAYPSRFQFKKPLQTNSSNKAFKGKIIVLVNESTMSRAEFTAMAFQTADNVVTVGNQTVGADGDVVRFEYLGGFQTAMSGNGIVYPDGTESQRNGVKIDIEVKPTIDGLRAGRDEVLEKALEIAKQ